MEILFSQIEPIIWFVGLSVVGYIFFHRFSDVIKEKIYHNATSRKRDNDPQMDQQFDQMLKNAPTLLNQINREIEDQKKNGVTDDQMKGLISKKSMLEFVAQNQEIVNMIGRPLVKKILGWVKHI